MQQIEPAKSAALKSHVLKASVEFLLMSQRGCCQGQVKDRLSSGVATFLSIYLDKILNCAVSLANRRKHFVR